MKRTIRRVLFLLLNSALLASPSLGQETPPADEQAVLSWIQQNAIPIDHVEAGNGFSDLQPLKQVLKDVKIVGLGEATHGTREFFTMKHRLLEFLITEMNFTAFVIESSYSSCQPINDYILSGKGDLATVLTGQGYMAWDTEEFSAMLDWMRAYNQKVPDEQKVKFYGNDLCFNGIGRERVLTFLKEHAPERVTTTIELFHVLAIEEEKWPTRLDQDALQQAFAPLQEIVSYFSENKDKLIAASSFDDWEKAFRDVQVMEQWLLANLQETPPALLSQRLGRSQYMGQNLLYLIEKEKPNTKFLYWAHDYHIGTLAEEENDGYYLRQRFGDHYYALGFECYQGTFQARELLANNTWGDLKADTILLDQGSYAWYFSGVKNGKLFLDFRSAYSNPVVDKWSDTPKQLGVGNWLYRSWKENRDTKKFKGFFDGIIFIEHSTPVQPTKNALVRSLNRIGF